MRFNAITIKNTPPWLVALIVVAGLAFATYFGDWLMVRIGQRMLSHQCATGPLRINDLVAWRFYSSDQMESKQADQRGSTSPRYYEAKRAALGLQLKLVVSRPIWFLPWHRHVIAELSRLNGKSVAELHFYRAVRNHVFLQYLFLADDTESVTCEQLGYPSLDRYPQFA